MDADHATPREDVIASLTLRNIRKLCRVSVFGEDDATPYRFAPRKSSVSHPYMS